MLLAGGDAQLERAWQAAQVWVPVAALPQPRSVPLTGRMQTAAPVLERLPAAASVPVVLYAHDCAGLGPEATAWGDRLVHEGYAVIAPDSRARADGAAIRCGAGDAAGLVTRQAEIGYALDQIRTLSWVRPHAVFLLAVGQGAAAAARDDGGGFTGAVLIGAAVPRSRRASPSLWRDAGSTGCPSDEEQQAVVDFLRALTPR
jgi:Dienelactone hydrolase family